MVLQGQKLHEDSKSYKGLEDFHEEYPQVNLILEDFVLSRRISDILEAQESGKPSKYISSASRHVPAKDGKETQRGKVWSADSNPPWSADHTQIQVGFRSPFSHVFSRL